MMASQCGYNDAGSSGQGISSELRARDLPSKRLLGKGLASIVYETEWNGERFARKDFIGVPSGTFQKEAAILVGLKDHENVVKTHGRTVDKMSCSLVLEYMDEDLLDLLQKRKESQRGASGTGSGSRCEGDPSYSFELSEAIAILSRIARGMEFLHGQNIPHGDLKTKNILVSHINDGDKNLLTVKVADFGLVRTKSKSMSFVSRQARKLDVVQWKAPEVLERLLSEDNDVTSSESGSDSDTDHTGSIGVSDRLVADVYSFAVTCSQILTGEDPYPNGNWKELASKIVSGELRPNLPAACPEVLKYLLELCWAKSPSQRPTFSFIWKRFSYWLVYPEALGHLSSKEGQENFEFLDDPTAFKSVSPTRSPGTAGGKRERHVQIVEGSTSSAVSKSSQSGIYQLSMTDSERLHERPEVYAQPTVALRELFAAASSGRLDAEDYAQFTERPEERPAREEKALGHLSSKEGQENFEFLDDPTAFKSVSPTRSPGTAGGNVSDTYKL